MKRLLVLGLVVQLSMLHAAVKMPSEFGRDYAFLNIVPAQTSEEGLRQLAKDIVEYRELTGCRLVLPSLSFHPDAKPATKKAQRLLDFYRALKKELAGTDIELGVLIQSIMGHWAVEKAGGYDDWTRSIDLNGKVWRFCPLDPGFRKYIEWFVTELARERPAFILTDDDMLCKGGMECFCPLHLKEANRRLGMNMTADEYRAAVKAAREGEKGHEDVFRVFNELAIEFTSGCAALIRKTIDAVDPSIPAGICQGAPIYISTGPCAEAIAAKGQPAVARLSNSCYRERSAKDFPRYMRSSFETECLSRDVPIRLDESDTFPHNLWSVSAVTFKAKIALAAMCGLNGSKIWLVNMHKGKRPVPREYTRVVAECGEMYRALAREVRGSVQKGFAVVVHTNDIATSTLTSYLTWGDRFGGVFGVPWRCTANLEEGGVYTLADAQDVMRCSDEDLKRLLSGRLLVDGRAAAELCARGYADFIGVDAIRKGKPPAPGVKIDTAFDIVQVRERIEKTGETLYHLYTSNTPELKNLRKGARVFSTFVRDSTPAAVVYDNKLGGRVFTAALDLGLESFEPWCRRGYDEQRKEWFHMALDELAGSRTEYAVVNDKNMAVIHRRKRDGSDLVCVWNNHYDPVVDLGLRVAAPPAKIEVLSPDGTWKGAEWKTADGAVEIKVDMPCYAFAVFRISK